MFIRLSRRNGLILIVSLLVLVCVAVFMEMKTRRSVSMEVEKKRAIQRIEEQQDEANEKYYEEKRKEESTLKSKRRDAGKEWNACLRCMEVKDGHRCAIECGGDSPYEMKRIHKGR
jgi:predicted Holliday junction resolvase-like endonuclease